MIIHKNKIAYFMPLVTYLTLYCTKNIMKNSTFFITICAINVSIVEGFALLLSYTD